MMPSSLLAHAEPSREAIDATPGLTVLEFGAGWCPICQAAQPLIQQSLSAREDIAHIKIEDGKGRKLGRSYSVKLWPTLVFLRDGQEVHRLVRPQSRHDIDEALGVLDAQRHQ